MEVSVGVYLPGEPDPVHLLGLFPTGRVLLNLSNANATVMDI